MKYAIVESGGKQYKAVEGETIEVDRLPVNTGESIDLERVLMMVDGDNVSVGTPTVAGIKVSTTVVDHVKGPKIIVFKYSPRKRIRVKGGHRQQYTRLMVDAIGEGGKAASKAKKAEPAAEKVEKKEAAAKKTEKKEAAVKKTEKKEAVAKKVEKAPAKKTTVKKTTTKKTSSTKKSEK